MKAIRIFLASLLIAGPIGAQADIITISGQGAGIDGDWDITFVETSYNDSQALLEAQVWWDGDSGALAEIFALALGYTSPTNFWVLGPYFAFDTVACGFRDRNTCAEIRTIGLFGNVNDLNISANQTRNFAIGRRVTAVPEPGTLLLLGLGLVGLGVSRRAKASSLV